MFFSVFCIMILMVIKGLCLIVVIIRLEIIVVSNSDSRGIRIMFVYFGILFIMWFFCC